ncbi:Protein NUD1 [Nakaseomyces bracarensis]|uniref:Protein NUD1 n=1 Tax=Nakaseomyces bracarensis TaxID=273131 RepID=A0ABR4NMA6_9SACH
MVQCLDRSNVPVSIFRNHLIQDKKFKTHNSSTVNLTASKSSTTSKFYSKLDDDRPEYSSDALDIDFAWTSTAEPVSDILVNSTRKPTTKGLQIFGKERKYTRRLDVSSRNLRTLNLFDHHDLEYLNCKNNHIKTLSILETCIHLTTINLSKNQIEALIPLNDIPMRKLDLSFNSIEGVVDFATLVNTADTDVGWASLEHLDLTGNKIRAIRNLNCLVNLRSLILDQNFIEELEDISFMTNLQEISLRENKLRSRFDIRRLPMQSLRILRIDACKGLKKWHVRPAHMEVLEIIDGIETDLPRFDLFPINLKFLKLAWISGLDKLPLNLCDIIPGLEELILTDNDLDDLRNILQAIPTTNLKRIDLAGNPLTKHLSPCATEKYKYAFHIACRKITDIRLQE